MPFGHDDKPIWYFGRLCSCCGTIFWWSPLASRTAATMLSVASCCRSFGWCCRYTILLSTTLIHIPISQIREKNKIINYREHLPLASIFFHDVVNDNMLMPATCFNWYAMHKQFPMCSILVEMVSYHSLKINKYHWLTTNEINLNLSIP